MDRAKLTESNKQKIADAFGVPRFMLGMGGEYIKTLLSLDRRGRGYRLDGALIAKYFDRMKVSFVPDRRTR